jgi:hypothetical protein
LSQAPLNSKVIKDTKDIKVTRTLDIMDISDMVHEDEAVQGLSINQRESPEKPVELVDPVDSIHTRS